MPDVVGRKMNAVTSTGVQSVEIRATTVSLAKMIDVLIYLKHLRSVNYTM